MVMMTTTSGVALAKDKTDVNSSTYAVEKLICNKTNVPATGAASPTYQAGVDGDGNAVAPADVTAVPTAMPDYIEVPVTIDLARKLGTAPTGTEINAPVANLKLYKDGRVEYNGQDISSNAASMCGYPDKSDRKQQKIEPASGRLMAAPVAPPEIPDDVTPQAGSVAPSSTSAPQKVIYKLQQGTQSRTPANVQ
jgi:hypothetical protein